jgi:hypothetical protein
MEDREALDNAGH